MNMKPQKVQVKSSRQYQKGIVVVIAMAILLLGITIGLTMKQKDRATAAREATAVVFDLATMDIAKQFACSCGSCNERNLAICTCSVAVSTKAFIETNLKNGADKEDVIRLIKDLYGHYVG
ncbi:MAG: hypothetical protein GXO92_06180 [FCB group bacterium]|nr:hypothetical protein [FCB group bacterium]